MLYRHLLAASAAMSLACGTGAPDMPETSSAGHFAQQAPGDNDGLKTWKAVPEHGGRASTGSTPLPCEVRRVLRTSCQGCHGAEPGLQAPMALVTREDLLAPAISDPGRRVLDLIPERIHSDIVPMPPVTSRALTDDEMAVLDGLVQDGGPVGDERCDGLPPPPADDPPIEDEIDQCYRFMAHDIEAPGDQTPFTAPAGEYYGCFFFEIPWGEDAQAVTFRSLDTSLTHHWALSDTTRAFEPGQIVRDAPNCGLGAERLLAVYGVNQQRELHMPQDVGLELPGPSTGRGLLLGVHFFNPGEETVDTAGVEVCTAREPRPHTATVSLLGSEFFVLQPGQETTVESYCTPQGEDDIHIFRSFPHMHARGLSFETVIERAERPTHTMLDVSYDFNNQIMYDTPAIVRPGDRLRTRCHFRNDTTRQIFSGDLEDNEMCVNFVYAWPAHALRRGKSLSGAVDTCLR